MSRKLLLADDSITIQKVIGITFVNEDFDLSVVDNGDDALEKARAERPDLVLADVFMPGKNGYELCAAIKAEPNLSRVPVLLLTGTFEPFDEAKAKSVGADGWISKPFESQTLIKRVEELLAKADEDEDEAATFEAEPPPPLAPPAEVEGGAEADLWEEFEAVPADAAAAEVAPPEVSSEAMEESDFANMFGPEEDADLVTQEDQLPDDIWGDVSFAEEDLAPEPAEKAELDDIWAPQQETEPIQEEAPAPALAEPDAPVAAVEADTGDDLFIFEDDEEAAVDATDKGPDLSEDLLVFDETESIPPTIDVGDDAELLELDEEDILSLDAEDIEAGDLSAEDSAVTQAATAEDDFLFYDEEIEPPAEEPVASGETSFTEPAAVIEAEVALEPGGQEAEPVTPEPFVSEAMFPVAQSAAVEAKVQALSDEELQAIIERVAGVVIERLAGTILEKIAWEVVPDLAERLIQDEIRQIKESVR